MSAKIYTFEENTKMNKKLTVLALFLFVSAIAFGAFGAHALKDILVEKWLRAFDTGVRYQFYGAILLLVLSFQNTLIQGNNLRWIYAFTIGLLLFVLSIYGLVLAEIFHYKASFLGPITPVGGFIMIISLLIFTINIARNK